jgi:hypothetical protein
MASLVACIAVSITRSQTVLILDGTVTGGTASVEAVAATAAGMTVEIVNNAQWSAKTTIQFASYRALILGDPTCGTLGSTTNTIASTAATWGPAVTGNVIIIGTDTSEHAGLNPGAQALIDQGIQFAIDDATNTGMFVTLSCYYAGPALSTPVPMLDGLASGGFEMKAAGGLNLAHVVAAHPALTGLTDSALSNWNQ